MPTELTGTSQLNLLPRGQDPPRSALSRGKRARPLFDPPIVRRAIVDSFVKLNPVTLAKNPVMFVVEVGAAAHHGSDVQTLVTHGRLGFELQIAAWLWFTVLFANFAEAMAEGRGKAQADSLRKTKTDATAKKAGQRWQSGSGARRARCARAMSACANRTT